MSKAPTAKDRTPQLQLRVTAEERAQLERAAKLAGVPLASYLRARLLGTSLATVDAHMAEMRAQLAALERFRQAIDRELGGK